MTDRELLELAAKAAGFEIHWPRQVERDEQGYGNSGLWIVNGSTCWNPLTDDGYALRLAVELHLTVLEASVRKPDGNVVNVWPSEAPDRFAATRRAIVRAAAEIGKAKGST